MTVYDGVQELEKQVVIPKDGNHGISHYGSSPSSSARLLDLLVFAMMELLAR
jgi:hypothetical protein